MTVEQMVKDLTALKPFIRFDQVALVGGETLLHPKVVEFMRAAAELEISDEVCVITNGDLLPRMKEEFWQELQVLRLSMYGEFKLSILELAQRKQTQYNFRLDAWEYPEFFKQLKSVPDDGVASFNSCEWRKECLTAHESHLFLCPQSAFFPKRIMGSDVNDGLPLADLTEEKLTAYLNRTEPFAACSVCMAGQKQAFPWREAKNKQDWLSASTL